MVLVPRPCLTCRHGVVIPAIVTASKVSVLHCHQRQPDVPDRTDCPRYERESRADERARRPAPEIATTFMAGSPGPAGMAVRMKTPSRA